MDIIIIGVQSSFEAGLGHSSLYTNTQLKLYSGMLLMTFLPSNFF